MGSEGGVAATTRAPQGIGRRDDLASGRIGLLGVFPALTCSYGGVQASGRIAWEGIAARSRHTPTGCVLFRYGERRGAWQPGTAMVSSRSRLAALAAALSREWPADVVLVWHLALLKLLPFFRLRGARVVLFLHGIEAWPEPTWPTRRLLKRVDLFLTNSEHTWRRFVDANPGHAGAVRRIVPLGLGAPLARSTPSPTGLPVALVVSRLLRGEDYKGHRELIAAWPLVLARVPEAELWIAGDGDLRKDLEAVVRARGLGARIRFWGEIGEEEKTEMIARCRCLAMPSRGEGFGLAYVEAMRMGRPCLVSTLDAGREVVGPPATGLAVDPRNPRQVADALCELLVGGSAWESWSLRARERYEAHFTAAHFQGRLWDALGPRL